MSLNLSLCSINAKTAKTKVFCRWSAGQNVLDYINWASHEPNNAFGGERCVIIEAVNG